MLRPSHCSVDFRSSLVRDRCHERSSTCRRRCSSCRRRRAIGCERQAPSNRIERGARLVRPQTSRDGRAAMEHHVGIGVSLELSSVCILDANGKIVKETKLASEAQVFVAFFKAYVFSDADWARSGSAVSVVAGRPEAGCVRDGSVGDETREAMPQPDLPSASVIKASTLKLGNSLLVCRRPESSISQRQAVFSLPWVKYCGH
jgi:hypothetical protein